MFKKTTHIENQTHFLSVDLEDWYTSAYLRKFVTPQNFESRIQESTELILTLFDCLNVKATFFVLGSIAEKFPNLIAEIHHKGHEIASHGFSHTPLWELDKTKFEAELIKTNDILSSITNKKVYGFRAPYASLDHSTSWSIEVLEKQGFIYDSSIFPMKTPLYGVKNAPLVSYKISARNIALPDEKGSILEIPFSVIKTPLGKIPCTGAIYNRFFPQALNQLLQGELAKKQALNFYFHPWEIDPSIPKIKAPILNRFVSYYNVKIYLKKIEKTLGNFEFTSFEKKLKL